MHQNTGYQTEQTRHKEHASTQQEFRVCAQIPWGLRCPSTCAQTSFHIRTQRHTAMRRLFEHKLIWHIINIRNGFGCRQHHWAPCTGPESHSNALHIQHIYLPLLETCVWVSTISETMLLPLLSATQYPILSFVCHSHDGRSAIVCVTGSMRQHIDTIVDSSLPRAVAYVAHDAPQCWTFAWTQVCWQDQRRRWQRYHNSPTA